MGSVSAFPIARVQRGFTETKESTHVSHTQSQPHPPLQKVEDGGWRLEDVALVERAGRGEEPWVCS